MKKYTIDIDESLWWKFKELATSKRLTLKEAILEAITEWMQRQGGER